MKPVTIPPFLRLLCWCCWLFILVRPPTPFVGAWLPNDNNEDNAQKLDLWSRGAFDFDNDHNNFVSVFQRMNPISRVRQDTLDHQASPRCDVTGYCQWRGGSQDDDSELTTATKLKTLSAKFGPEFVAAIQQNEKEHDEDCQASCELYYCAPPLDKTTTSLEDVLGNQTTIKSYSMGPVPPEDFAESFGYPLDIIKVTQGEPLFHATEAATVIAAAEAEGVHQNEFQSGKYQLAGDWLDKLPNTRQWFNTKLQTTFFPLLAHLFPEVISSPSVIRAHSVSLLKYNASHPRTDVHIDNGILAMTIAMTPTSNYMGGGTYFEHMGVENVLAMNVGHGTFRPGSVRHGGHRVVSGTRYILGAFLLLQDKVEHVRRLKNRGSVLRREQQDLIGAAKHFEWALAMNPKCTTCLKDWAEILHRQKEFVVAEEKIRTALELLEYKDSDALFTLGVLLSEQGRDEESIDAYRKSIALNAEDAELCYNLGIKLGAKGLVQEERQMYAKATKADPKFGGAWLNWGTSLAENGNLDDAELMFLKALDCEHDVIPKAMMNLGLLYNTRGNMLAQMGDLAGAKAAALDGAKYLDQGKPLLDALVANGKADGQILEHVQRYRPLRLQSHRLVGQLHAGTGDLTTCELEFQTATNNFPYEPLAWQMFHRILEMQGKTEEAKAAMDKFLALSK